MKVLILTTELTVRNGWGRYSVNLIRSLNSNNIVTATLLERGAENETEIKAIHCLPRHLTYKVYYLAFLYAWKLRGLAKDCDVVHSLVEPYSVIAFFLSLFTRKRYFITAHGTFGVFPYTLNFLKRSLHHLSFSMADKIFCVSRYTENRLREFNLSNLEVVNNGIDMNRFPAYAEELLKENVIVTVGALNPAKGLDVALRAVSLLGSRINFKYLIVGKPSSDKYFKSLKDQVVTLGIEDKVHFLGQVGDKELIDLYLRSKVFLLPSVNIGSDFEGFGLVYLEANACGLPVIGSFGTGAEDAIRDGITGILVPQNNPNAISVALEKILCDEKTRINMGRVGRIWAEKCDWSIVCLKYIGFYGEEN